MAKRKNIVCVLRRCKTYTLEPNNGMVARDPQDQIYIRWVPCTGERQTLSGMSSREARLLAKRINQFLDSGG